MIDSLPVRVARRFGTLSAAWQWLATIALASLLAVGDQLTGAKVAFTALYFAPIALGAWFRGRALALAVAAIASVMSISMELQANLDAHPAVHVWNALISCAVFVTVAYLVTGLRRVVRRERERARTDTLTGVLSRLGFLEDGERELLRAHRFNHPLTLAYLDLDSFKRVNDAEGHEAGDRVLRQVADAVRSELRAVDLVGRLGGDEFAVLFPETGPSEATQAVGRLRERLARLARSWALDVGFSVGVVSWEVPPPTLDDALAEADRRMYSEKRAHHQVRLPGPGPALTALA